MKDRLAEGLLAKVMGWSPEDVATYLPPLQAMAAYKYDDYQQFSAGMRFMESLALWLQQFKTPQERVTAFNFIRSKLTFISSAEINHLVSVSYPDHLKPWLLSRAAERAGFPPWAIGKVAASSEFRMLERQALFLGLSDGARIDIFRRSNPGLSHEQIRQSHELSKERVLSLLHELKTNLQDILAQDPPAHNCTFRTIVLIDDFAGTGLSYLRKDEEGRLKGKVAKFFEAVTSSDNAVSKLIDPSEIHVVVMLYMATHRAKEYLSGEVPKLFHGAGIGSRVVVVYEFPESLPVQRGQNPDLDKIIDKYYDSKNEDSSTEIGGTDLKYGFSGCGLPLVLSHNTPNNSIGLLWAKGPKMQPLFPRVSRHKDSL
jgi:hypothetical protein